MNAQMTFVAQVKGFRSRATPRDRRINRPQPRPISTEVMNRTAVMLFRLFAILLIATSVWAKERPYKGSAAGEVLESTFIGNPQPDGVPFLREHAVAEGEFTHLGRSNVQLNWLVSAEVIDGELVYLTVGTFVITGADGDSMDGSFRSWQLASAQDSLIEVEVSHGTGRFARARGIIPGIGRKQGNLFSYSLSGVLDF